MQKFSKGEAIRFGWERVRGKLWFFVGLLLVYALLTYSGQILAVIFSYLPEFLQTPLSLVATLFGVVVSTTATIGLIKISLKTVDGQEAFF